MPINIDVVTYNEHPNGGGFHEMHRAECLSSSQHALETVKNILDLNIRFCGYCVLTGVDIGCSDDATLSLVHNYYAGEKEIKVCVDKLRRY